MDIDAGMPTEAGALRDMTRAQEFGEVILGHHAPRLIWTIQPNNGDELAHFKSEGDNLLVPHILLERANSITDIIYHEYGHYWEYDLEGSYSCGASASNHAWESVTSDGVAWVEGFAEFYCAAAHTYWYKKEMPQPIAEPFYFLTDPVISEWPDAGMSALVTKSTSVEGCVATFLYNFLDNILPRFSHFTGDNEDLECNGSWITSSLSQGAGCSVHTFLNSFKNVVSNNLNYAPLYSLHEASIMAMYNFFMSGTGKPRPATPTILNIDGDGLCGGRILNWNDNTEPSDISFVTRCFTGSGGASGFELVRNNENGFKIYKKKTNAPWDQTLQGYTFAGQVGVDKTGWGEFGFVNKQNGGMWSYVVVAFDNNGNSIPRAEAKTFIPGCDPVSDRKIFVVDKNAICKSTTGLVAVAKDSHDYHYQWIYQDKPSFISLSVVGLDSSILSISNNYISGSIGTLATFQVGCIVTDSDMVKDTSEMFHPNIIVSGPCDTLFPSHRFVYQDKPTICPATTGNLNTTGEWSSYVWQVKDKYSFLNIGDTSSPSLTITNNYVPLHFQLIQCLR